VKINSPGGIALHPSAPRLYVANFGSDTVSVIDTDRNAVIATINTRTDPNVRTAPNDIALSPRGDRAYVTLPNSNQLAVLDTSDNSMLRAVPIGSDPIERAIPNGVEVAPGMQSRQPHTGVGLIDAAVGFDAQRSLGNRFSGRQPGRALVAGAGVDAVQRDHQPPRVRHQKTPTSRTTVMNCNSTRSRISLLE